MGTSRNFAYNTGSQITGATQYGNLAIGVTISSYGNDPGGVKWWGGPDEDLGYVIAHTVPSGNQPNPKGLSCSVGFWRTTDLSDITFLTLVSQTVGQSFLTASVAKDWLNTNGYWTSYSSSGGGPVSSSLEFLLDAASYTSGTWIDETGNGNNATINGATWLNTNGGIFDFDGTDDNISIPDTSDLRLSTSVSKTIQVWVKFDVLPSTTQQFPVFGKLSSSFGFDGYWGGLYSSTGQFRSVTNGTSLQRVTSSGTFSASINTWYLFTFISKISSTSNSTKMYLNTTQIAASDHGTDSYNETNPLYLGWIGSGVGSFYLNGKIGAAYFYTKELSESEISDNFNNTKSRFGL
jgi:hypothetical protein